MNDMQLAPEFLVSMPSAPKPRARLSEEQVIAIFQARASAWTATKMATVYGVSEKAIRDIWTGRTWARETWRLDTSRPLQLKLAGRPKGCKDRNPRKKRANGHADLPIPARVLCRPHVEWSAENTCDSHEASQSPCHVHIADSQEACIKDSSACHRPCAELPTSSTLRHASVDEQLDEWDGFWLGASSVDPFCGDWVPFGVRP
jgi:hypothetical protein